MPAIKTIGSSKHSGVRPRTQLLVIHTAETPLRAGYETTVTTGTNSSTRQASWHYWAGPTLLTEMVRHDRTAWHARGANTISIGFEQSGYARFNAEWDTANGKAQTKILAWAVAREAKRYDIPLRWLTTAEVKKALAGDRSIKGMCRHSQIDPARRTDPGANYPAKRLLSLAKSYADGKAPVVTPQATRPPVKQPTGGTVSVVDWLRSKKRDASFDARAKLAKQYGISPYAGTAGQNTQLLAALKAGDAPAPQKPPAKKPATSKMPADGSVVNWLNGQKRDSSFSARASLAKQYGISGYEGTASQNTDLLKKLVGGSAPAKAPTKAKPKQKVTGSVVDYLKSKGKESSFSARLRLAAQHGIRHYKGTSAQNRELLSKLQD